MYHCHCDTLNTRRALLIIHKLSVLQTSLYNMFPKDFALIRIGIKLRFLVNTLFGVSQANSSTLQMFVKINIKFMCRI